jgi:hypothetical protein
VSDAVHDDLQLLLTAPIDEEYLHADQVKAIEQARERLWDWKAAQRKAVAQPQPGRAEGVDRG